MAKTNNAGSGFWALVKNWHAFHGQVSRSVTSDSGPFKVGACVQACDDVPEGSAAHGLHRRMSYVVEGYTATGGVRLRGYMLTVAAKHLVPSTQPVYGDL